MLNREFKINFKSFIIWLLILIGMFLLVFLMYPSIIASNNVDMINEMIKVFPEELLMAFNMDISSLDSVFGWMKSEGFIIVLLISGVYSAILGSNILLKEENEKTIEYLISLPISRNKILINKLLCGFIYVVSLIIFLGIFNFVGLVLSGNFDVKTYLLLSITPLLSSVVIYFLCFYFSLFTHKTKNMLGVSLGIVFISYFIQVISQLSDKVQFLKYFSIFSLSDIRNVIVNVTINPICIFISIGLSVLFILIIFIKYNKKELI